MSETQAKILARNLRKGGVGGLPLVLFRVRAFSLSQTPTISEPGTGKVFFYKPEGNVV